MIGKPSGRIDACKLQHNVWKSCECTRKRDTTDRVNIYSQGKAEFFVSKGKLQKFVHRNSLGTSD